MTETTVDVPLLRKVMDHITAHPELHDQEVWMAETACGTVGCIAGWTVVLGSNHELPMSAATAYEAAAMGVLRSAEIVRNSDGGYIGDVGSVAGHMLGLTDDEAFDLFWDSTSLDQVWETVERLTSGEIQRPASSSPEAGR